MSSERLQRASEQLGRLLEQRSLRVITAESCTGGWISKVLTDIAGSSAWVEGGFVSYSNRCKERMLGVAPALIASHGAVSEPVVRAMAEGALAHSDADLSVAVTGVAGPDGGTRDKPVGLVWFGWAGKGYATHTASSRFSGDRDAVRLATVLYAIRGLRDLIEND